MSRARKMLTGIAITLVVLIVLLFSARRYALIYLVSLAGAPPLIEAGVEGPQVAWFDDYYTVEAIDPETFALGEPRYYQRNYNYLILGTERALLFDSGPGVRDIRPLVSSLTELPVTAVPSHLHYDHIGWHSQFENLALVDLPYLRERAHDGELQPTRWEHLGFVEERPNPPLQVTEWWPPGHRVDLGGRVLEVLHTPGHTYDSISLLDRERGLLFTGDYMSEGALLSLVPGGSLGDYLETAERLVDQVSPETQLLTAHRGLPHGGAPVMQFDDLRDLRTALREIRDGKRNSLSFVFEVNDHLTLISDIPLLEGFEPTRQ